ncbi:MAG TPA: YqzK family protein [Candidatus Avamphibacillus sp.]|nr:YqzK family protein [Candidatus Avamphibacillus sp.]
MSKVLWDMIKVFIIFIACTFVFYYGLRMMHSEYEQFHRYDPPEGPAVKVFNEEKSFIDRLNLFFRLGE